MGMGTKRGSVRQAMARSAFVRSHLRLERREARAERRDRVTHARHDVSCPVFVHPLMALSDEVRSEIPPSRQSHFIGTD